MTGGPLRGKKEMKFTPCPTTFGGSTVAQKCEVYQDVPFYEAKFQNVSPDMPHENVFSGPAMALDVSLCLCGFWEC